jgi:fibronectin type 3 domain-containing protein
MKAINNKKRTLAAGVVLLGALLSWGCSQDLKAPGNITASCDTNDDGIKVQWDGVSGATYYHLEKREKGFADYGEAFGGQDTRFTDTGIDEGTTYEYRVKAKESTNSSDYAGPVEGCDGSGCSCP